MLTHPDLVMLLATEDQRRLIAKREQRKLLTAARRARRGRDSRARRAEPATPPIAWQRAGSPEQC